MRLPDSWISDQQASEKPTPQAETIASASTWTARTTIGQRSPSTICSAMWPSRETSTPAAVKVTHTRP